MKHISAHMGSPKTTIVKKRAWWPKRASSEVWIHPFETYYTVLVEWAPQNTPDGRIFNQRTLTKWEFILEGLNVKNS